MGWSVLLLSRPPPPDLFWGHMGLLCEQTPGLKCEKLPSGFLHVQELGG